MIFIQISPPPIPPPPPPGLPIDSHLILLCIAAVFIGIFKLRQIKKRASSTL